MPISPVAAPTPRRPLRLWPGVLAAVLIVLVRFVVPLIVPGSGGIAAIGALAGGLAVMVWWLFFSRAPWSERLGAIALMAVALFATSRVVHESIRGGMMGMMLPVYGLPGLGVGLVAWAVGSRRLAGGRRYVALGAVVLLACGPWTTLRTDGITGAGDSQLAWRWTPTAEERLLTEAPALPTTIADSNLAPAAPPAPPATTAETVPVVKAVERPADAARTDAAAEASLPAAAEVGVAWPGFRGSGRDSIIRGVRIGIDWSSTPPVEMWRRAIGPGWSSFAVGGSLLYTQEQRGEDEIVSCYRLTTGEPVWTHGDAVRFYESNGGAGPRATPALSDGRVYTLGATGVVNALDARTGALVWSRNAASDTGAKLPGWGFAGSPLVVDELVIVAASGALAAYDRATGTPRWVGTPGGGGYSSPQLATIDGVEQVVMMSGTGVTGVAPADGAVLWEHPWPGDPIVQPALTADGGILVSTGGMTGAQGTRRLAVARGAGGWSVEERWTSNGLKPYFNDFVVHEGHAYGFDGFILASINLEDGTRTWKGGRYGNGQLVLLPDQDLLLVVSEDGEVALVQATPDRFTEVARIPAIEGKTWNHPVLAGDVLLVRNGEEMVAFRMPIAR